MKDGRSKGAAAPAGGEERPAVFRRRLDTRDFDELAHAFLGWEADFRQIGRGSFHGELDFAQTGTIQLLRVQTDRVIQARGRCRASSYTFPLITSSSREATWRGRRLHAGQLRVMGPAGEMDHLTSDEYESLDVSVDAELLRRKASVLYGIDLDECLAGRFAVAADRGAFSALETTLRGLLAGHGPAVVRPCAVPDARQVEDLCVRQLLRALASAVPALESPIRNVNRAALLRRAEEFMAARLAAGLRSEDLCAELDVSERTLRYVFQDRYGLGPMAYFKTQKLNVLRRGLKAADAAGLSVNALAAQWGFDHTGNLAADYRRQFGELPSQTLRGLKSQ